MKYFAAASLAIIGFVTLLATQTPAPLSVLFGWIWLAAGLLTFIPDFWRLPQSRLTHAVMRVVASAWLFVASVIGLFGLVFAVEGVVEITRHEATGAAVLLVAAVLHAIVAHALAEPAVRAHAARRPPFGEVQFSPMK